MLIDVSFMIERLVLSLKKLTPIKLSELVCSSFYIRRGSKPVANSFNRMVVGSERR